MKKPPLNAYANLSSGARGLNFSLINLHLHPDFVYPNIEGSDESAHLCTHLSLGCSSVR